MYHLWLNPTVHKNNSVEHGNRGKERKGRRERETHPLPLLKINSRPIRVLVCKNNSLTMSFIHPFVHTCPVAWGSLAFIHSAVQVHTCSNRWLHLCLAHRPSPGSRPDPPGRWGRIDGEEHDLCRGTRPARRRAPRHRARSPVAPPTWGGRRGVWRWRPRRSKTFGRASPHRVLRRSKGQKARIIDMMCTCQDFFLTTS